VSNTPSIRITCSAAGQQLAMGERTTLADGTPVRRFKRYALKIGETYVKRGWKQPLRVTEDRASHWLSQWQAMKTNGVPLKITKDHENRELADSTRGDIVDITREGEWIAIVHDVRGEKNIEMAEANKDGSVEIEPRIVDGKGNVYRDAIAAYSYTPIPIVNDQPIAASLADDTYHLSTGDPEMQELLCSIASLVGVAPESITAENARKHIEDHAARCASLKLSLDDANQKLTDAQAQVLKLSAKPETDKRFLSMQAKLAASPLTRLVDKGVLSPASRDKFAALFVGDSEKAEYSPLMLSLSAEDDGAAGLVEKVCAIIEGNAPVKPGEQTPAQHLNRHVPDAEKAKEEKKPNPWFEHQ
jgi:hypothetical protein